MKNDNIVHFPSLFSPTSVPEPCKDKGDSVMNESEFVTVKELASMFGLSRTTIYELIQHEPNFPFVNLGKKKKYLINLNGFKEWLKSRQRLQEADVPTAFDLLRRYRK